MIDRVGIGTDLHRLESGRKLILGGVEIPFDKGPLGHSDGDVVLHALIDALLGAVGLPDIGDRFPDTDSRWKDADSRSLLADVAADLAGRGFQTVNVDIVIHAERPRLTPHKDSIRRSVARLLDIEAGCVSVKAKTNEGFDAIGRGEAIGCTAIVGVSRTNP